MSMDGGIPSTVSADSEAILEMARRVLSVECAAMMKQLENLSESFVCLVRMLEASAGRIVVIGMGKSGHIARKFVATLLSIGQDAFFLHPAEARHGDMGAVHSGDVVFALSHSGATQEVIALIPLLKQRGCRTVGMSGFACSPLASVVDHHYVVEVPQEACFFNLVPTASTTAVLAVCDAIAMVLGQLSGFREVDFFEHHPGGVIGYTLSLTAKQLMRDVGEDMPLVYGHHLLGESLGRMSAAGLGILIVVTPEQQVMGVFTDGDLRRQLQKYGAGVLDRPLSALISGSPITVTEEMPAKEVLMMMEVNKITQVLVVCSRGCCVGIIHIHDILPLTGV